MGSQDSFRIDRCYTDMVDNPDCDDYSWGTDVFEFTLHYLKKSIHTREQMHIFQKAERGGYLYRCYGLILALQTWFYEVCDTTEGVVSTYVGVHDIPRIIKWEVRDTYTRIFMEMTFSNLHHSKFNNIVPTEVEKQTLLLDSFFQKKKNEFTPNDIPSSGTPQHPNESDVITRLSTITSELESLKQAFFDFSRRVFAEFDFFKEKLLVGVKSPGRILRIESEALQKSAKDNVGVKSPGRVLRTKSEALQKSATDKPGHIEINVVGAGVNLGPVGKHGVGDRVIPENVDKNASEKVVNPGHVEKNVPGKNSCPFAVDFDITVSGKVYTKNYNDWIAEGLLKCSPRKVANGYVKQ
ncbi:Unknown protein [Striga hermonthica]|uniref:Uncharacterized protein n=1 Tax=Striga hermonthica TaxID=68872 RepID=A0A9N7P135_STRHE|nr:Unknown protein [Striga hermonthica]